MNLSIILYFIFRYFFGNVREFRGVYGMFLSYGFGRCFVVVRYGVCILLSFFYLRLFFLNIYWVYIVVGKIIK